MDNIWNNVLNFQCVCGGGQADCVTQILVPVSFNWVNIEYSWVIISTHYVFLQVLRHTLANLTLMSLTITYNLVDSVLLQELCENLTTEDKTMDLVIFCVFCDFQGLD